MGAPAAKIKLYSLQAILFFNGLVFCLDSYAQQSYDTVTIEEGYKQYEEDNQYDAGTRKKYFLNRWEQDDSLVLQQRNIPAKDVKELQQQDAFWYANTDIKKEKPAQKKLDNPYVPLGQQIWFQTLLWLLIIGGFAAAVMWFLAGSQVGLFRKRNKAAPTKGETNEIPEDIFAINYQQEIDKAARSGNYRLAVRLMFLRLLKNMSERNIIQYKQDKTNLDYLIQLRPTSYYNKFFRITRNYEYAWYGLFAINETAYQAIENDFKDFDRFLG